MKSILGIKEGMTQIFGDKGVVIPVTVIKAGPCAIVQIKTKEVDGYTAIVVAFEDIKKARVNKPIAGIFKKAGVTPKRHLQEFRVEEIGEMKVGDVLTVENFAVGDAIDVTAKTKGHGTTGRIKRWNQQRGPMAHGSSTFHRMGGSVASGNSNPSRIFKNTHMAGQYGNETVTLQNLTVVRVDADKNCLLVKGGIPGANGALITIKSAVKGGAKK